MKCPRVRMCPDGPEVSQIVFGTMRLLPFEDPAPAGSFKTAEEILAIIKRCVAMGITTFDLAPVYGLYNLERAFGEALALEPSVRDQIEIVTKANIQVSCPKRPDVKVHSYDTSKAHLLWSVEESLKALGTDRLDVLLVHRADPLMDADDVAEAFNELKTKQKVKHFGVSNFSASQFELLQSRLDFPLVTNQVEYSCCNVDMLYNGVFDQAQRLRRRPMIWSPLGGGAILSASPTDITDRQKAVRTALATIAAQFDGKNLDDVAYAFVLRHPVGAIMVLGTTNLDRVETALKVLTEPLMLTNEQYFTILTAAQGHDIP